MGNSDLVHMRNAGDLFVKYVLSGGSTKHKKE